MNISVWLLIVSNQFSHPVERLSAKKSLHNDPYRINSLFSTELKRKKVSHADYIHSSEPSIKFQLAICVFRARLQWFNPLVDIAADKTIQMKSSLGNRCNRKLRQRNFTVKHFEMTEHLLKYCTDSQQLLACKSKTV